MNMSAAELTDVAELKKRVDRLEDRIGQYDKILLGIEGTMSLILEEQMGYKRDLYIFKQEVNQRFNEVNQRFEEVNQRFDKSEELLITIVNHLTGK